MTAAHDERLRNRRPSNAEAPVEGLDLVGLEKIAREATQTSWTAEVMQHNNREPKTWEFWVKVPGGENLFLDCGPSPGEPYATFTSNGYGHSPDDQAWRDVSFIAAFDPPTAIALLSALKASEAKVRELEARLDAVGEDPTPSEFEQAMDRAVRVAEERCARVAHLEAERDNLISVVQASEAREADALAGLEPLRVLAEVADRQRMPDSDNVVIWASNGGTHKLTVAHLRRAAELVSRRRG